MKWKTMFVVVALITMFVGLTAQTPFETYDFENFADAAAISSAISGTGTIPGATGALSKVGVTATGIANTTNGSTLALTTTGYPANTTGLAEGTHGIEITASTVGKSNIVITWETYNSGTAANRARLQYATEGNNWTYFEPNENNAYNYRVENGSNSDLEFEGNRYKTPGNGYWIYRKADLSTIQSVNNNPNFKVRFVTAFPEGSNAYSGAGGNYGTGGTMRFDNITFTGTTYQPPSSVTLPIFTPNGGTHLTPPSVTIESSAGASIYYTTDGSTPDSDLGADGNTSTLYTVPITITVTGTVIKAKAYLNAEASEIATSDPYYIVTVTEKTSILALKATTPDPTAIYKITGNMIVTHILTNRNQKFIQDVPAQAGDPVAGILIDIEPDVGVNTAYAAGDIITNLQGVVKTLNGMLVFVPTETATPTSQSNPVTATTITLAQLTSTPEDYTAMLVKVTDVYFTQSGNFAVNTAYPFTDGTDTFTFRANFSAVTADNPDYITAETAIPTTLQNITGHIFTNTSGTFLSARAIADFENSSTQIAVPPSNVLVKALGRNVVITWELTTPTPPTGFNVERKLGEGSYVTANSSLIPAIDRAYVDENVAWGEYTYKVVAVYAGGGEDSEEMPLSHQLGAKSLFISEYYHNQGSNKVIEIYNPFDEAEPLANYQLKSNLNGNSTTMWTNNTYNIDLSGSIPAHGTLIVYNSGGTSYGDKVEEWTNDTTVHVISRTDTQGVMQFNGNDPIGLFKDGVLIDTFGLAGYCGAGGDTGSGTNLIYIPVAGSPISNNINVKRSPNVYKGNAVWSTVAEANSATSEWIRTSPSVLTDLGLHSYTDPNPPQPPVASLSITLAAGYYATAQSAEISTTTAGASIYYTTDGSAPNNSTGTLYSGAITVDHTMTLKAIGYATDHSPSLVAEARYVILEPVASIHALRAIVDPPADQVYKIMGDVIVTHTLNNRNQSFIQDLPDAQEVDPDIAGIIIDDDEGTITVPLVTGDIIDGGNLFGKLTSYQGMLQFEPIVDVTANDTGTATPVLVTLDLLEATPLAYQSMLVKVDDVIFEESGDFVRATEYHITNGDGTFPFKAFALGDEPDFIGDPIPTRLTDLTGIVYTSTPTTFLSARDANDIDEHAGEEPMPPLNLGYSIVDKDITITWNIANQTILQGFNVYRNEDEEFADGDIDEADPLNETLIPFSEHLSYIDEDVDYGLYYYYVEAVYTGATSEFSAPLMVNHEEIIIVPLFISEYVEGASNSRAIEIFNPTDEPVSLADYTLKVSTDGAEYNAPLVLAGNIAAFGRHIIYNNGGSFGYADNAAFVAAVGAVPGVTLQAANTYTMFTGNDAIGLFYEDALIDIFGIAEAGETPPADFNVAGEVGAASRHTIVRKPTIDEGNTNWAESAGTTASDSEWIIYPANTFGHLGQHDFADDDAPKYIATPTISIAGGTYATALSVTLACATDGAVIRYTTDGEEPLADSDEYTVAIEITATTTLKVKAFKAEHVPSFTATAAYTILTGITPTPVASIHALRTQTAGNTTVYKIEGDVVVTKVLVNRSQRFIQDVSVGGSTVAGIMIDHDANIGGVITSYAAGDIIPGGSLIGRLINYNGMLEFTPMVTAHATSHDNAVEPTVVTLGDLSTGINTYQSMLVKVVGVSITGTGNFVQDTRYTITNSSGSYLFRTNFNSTDIGSWTTVPIPTMLVDITGLVYTTRVSGTDYNLLTARDAADIVPSVETPIAPSGLASSITGNNVTITWSAPVQVILQGFNIWRSQQIDGTYTKLNGDNLLSDRTYTDENLTFGTYYYKVDAEYMVAGTPSTLTSDPFTVYHAALVNLFISEYVEGAGFAKAIEIFNPTTDPVNLSNYSLKLNTNGGPAPTDLVTHNFTGTIAGHGMVIVYNNTTTSANLVNDMVPDLEALENVTLVNNNNVANFNGNDPIGLYFNNTLIDTFGAISGGNANISVAGQSGVGVDHTIIRKNTVTQGNIDWAESAGTDADDSEWVVHTRDYFNTDNTLGHHTFGTPPEVVATPTFSPEGGTYGTAQTVTISCTTEGAEIRYTLTGDDPTEASTLYEGAITISTTTTLKAIGYKAGYTESAVATAEYTITTGGTINPLPPSGLVATLVAPRVDLTWMAPNAEVYTHATTNNDGFYVGPETSALFGEYKLMHRFTAAQIAEMGMAGKMLKEVAFVTSTAAIDFTVYVYTGVGSGATGYTPNDLVASKAVPASDIVLNNWTYVTLDTPVEIPNSGQLWIGYGGTVNMAGFFAGVDDNLTTSANGFGNIISFGDYGWTSLVALNAMAGLPVITRSWMIKGIVDVEDDFVAPVSYNVYRKLSTDTAYPAQPLINVTARSHSDIHTETGIYNYVVKAVYSDAQESVASNEVTINVNALSVSDVTAVATSTLHANYPNPFNPSTTISFSVATEGNVAINVYNVRGQHVKTLVNRVYGNGVHSVVWNGLDDSGRSVGNGVYFYRMTCDGFTQTKKMLLMK